jgi:hypothetical protein
MNMGLATFKHDIQILSSSYLKLKKAVLYRKSTEFLLVVVDDFPIKSPPRIASSRHCFSVRFSGVLTF